MKWENLLSLKRHGDSLKRLRSEQGETRVGFDVTMIELFSHHFLEHFKTKHKLYHFQKQVSSIQD